jgi:hypothetical protein
LARTLHWGPGYAEEKISPILHKIETATVHRLDRWQICMYPIDEDTGLVAEVPTRCEVMNNYFSIGMLLGVQLFGYIVLLFSLV